MGRLIGYGKIGRSMPLTLAKCGNLGGDVEMVPVIKELAERHPNDTFLLLGRNSGEDPQSVGLPSNIVNPWHAWGWADQLRERGKPVRANHAHNANGSDLTIKGHQLMREIFTDITLETFRECDGHVFWVGQHGSTNTPIPMVNDYTKLTKPYDWCTYYVSFILQGINAWRGDDPDREEIWLNADARNKHKMRDLKYPLKHPVLTQFDFSHGLKHEQYDGVRILSSHVKNVYSRLEINALAPETPFGELIQWNGSYDRMFTFGMFINEARAIGVKTGMSRLDAVRDWVLPAEPNWIHGTWSNASQKELDREIIPAPWDQYFPMLNRTLCTLTTPSSGSGWATTKPWEAFAAGTVCFFHPAYDTQNHILKDAPDGLAQWLRLEKPRDLKVRIAAICANPNTFRWIIEKQRQHFDNAMKEKRYLQMIESRLGYES